MAARQVILVTADSVGLGASLARLFAKHGYRVVVNYAHNSDHAEKLLKELSDISTQFEVGPEFHKAIQADLASQDDVKRLVADTISSMGRIDVILSNGVWSKFADMTSLDDDVSDEVWDRAYAMNVKSHLWLLHAARPALDESAGAFITTASIAGLNNSGSCLVVSVDDLQRPKAQVARAAHTLSVSKRHLAHELLPLLHSILHHHI
jgi:NAD(P)-dependent dehydrogenase (short-subunit alcohol dehydrogenase family)